MVAGFPRCVAILLVPRYGFGNDNGNGNGNDNIIPRYAMMSRGIINLQIGYGERKREMTDAGSIGADADTVR